MPEWTFIQDQHTQARGEPVMLRLICDRCKHECGWYQKDGPGPLKRCYLDRFHRHPILQYLRSATALHDLPPVFLCTHCNEEIGVRMLYCGELLQGRMTHAGEHRLAIRLFNAVLIEDVMPCIPEE